MEMMRLTIIVVVCKKKEISLCLCYPLQKRYLLCFLQMKEVKNIYIC